MIRYRIGLPIAVVCAILAFAVVRNLTQHDAYCWDSALMMDTVVEIGVWGRGNVPADAAVDSAFGVMSRVDSLFRGRFVHEAQDTEVIASGEFRYLMDISSAAYEMTLGSFDPTIGSVSRLWGFWDGAEPPPRDSIEQALAAVGLARYLLGERGRGVVFDLGGIAKGYAVDLAAQKLRGLGFRSAIINAGGDLSLVGKRPDGRPWRIAIRHPRQRGTFIGYLDLEDVSVATSGDYEKYFIFDGRRYHHILDPRTGWPGHASASVTVVASGTCLSDALATGLFVMGPEMGLGAVEGWDGVEAVFVHADGDSLEVSRGLAGSFGRFEPE